MLISYLKSRNTIRRFHGDVKIEDHCSDVIWASWRLKSLATRLFIQGLVNNNNKENIKAPSNSSFEGNLPKTVRDRSLQRPLMQKKNIPLQWRHNERDAVSNHRRLDCLFGRLLSANQRKHQSSASLVFVRRIRRWPVNSSHKGPGTRKMFPFDGVNIPSHAIGILGMKLVSRKTLGLKRTAALYLKMSFHFRYTVWYILQWKRKPRHISFRLFA